jgi:hypothetical protein
MYSREEIRRRKALQKKAHSNGASKNGSKPKR